MAEKPYIYNRFIGLDAISDRRQMGERFLEICEHAFVDLRGQINKLPGHKIKTGLSTQTVMYVEAAGEGVVVYGQKNGANIDLKEYRSVATPSPTGATGWTWGSNIDFATFLTNVFVINDGLQAWLYGPTVGWVLDTTPIIPAAIRGRAITSVLSRLVIGGYAPTRTEIAVSKASANDFTVSSSGAGDAARIDIRDDITSNDEIVGLGTFEGNKVAIFLRNETILYVADPDIANWSILRDFRIPIGTIGKRTIKRVGNDLFFASRFGVHSIRRAVNGVTLESITFSRVVQDIYERLIANLHATWEPRAVWDPNKAHYYLFMPQVGDYWAKLTFTIEPSGRQPHLSWGYTPNGGWADGSYFNGNLHLAVPDLGLCNSDKLFETDTAKMRVRTAVLYQGAPQRRKTYKRLLVRASGDAKLRIRAYNADRELLDDDVFSNYPFTDTKYTPERPLDLPFEHYDYGVQIEFESEDKGDLRIMDFAIIAE